MKLIRTILFDPRAKKEINRFPKAVNIKVNSLLKVLTEEGQLSEPDAKKINDNLFEIRIRYQGQWRILYAYGFREYIVILTAFQKKTQRTPLAEIQKARKRLKDFNYEYKTTLSPVK